MNIIVYLCDYVINHPVAVLQLGGPFLVGISFIFSFILWVSSVSFIPPVSWSFLSHVKIPELRAEDGLNGKQYQRRTAYQPVR